MKQLIRNPYLMCCIGTYLVCIITYHLLPYSSWRFIFYNSLAVYLFIFFSYITSKSFTSSDRNPIVPLIRVPYVVCGFGASLVSMVAFNLFPLSSWRFLFLNGPVVYSFFLFLYFAFKHPTDGDGDSNFPQWSWRAPIKWSTYQVQLASIVFLLLYASHIPELIYFGILTDAFSNLGTWPIYSRNIYNTYMSTIVYAIIILMPVIQLRINLALIYCWRRLVRKSMIEILPQVCLLMFLRLFVAFLIIQEMNGLFEVFNRLSRGYIWSNDYISGLTYELLYLGFKCVWVFCLLRLNTVRQKQGLSQLDFKDIFSKAGQCIYTRDEAIEDFIFRYFAPRKFGRSILLIALIIYILINTLSGTVWSKMQLKFVLCGVICALVLVLACGRLLYLFASTSGRIILSELYLTPIGISRLFQLLTVTPLRHFTVYSIWICVFLFIESLLSGHNAAAMAGVYIGCCLAGAILYVLLIPGILYSALRHKSLGLAIVRQLFKVALIEMLLFGVGAGLAYSMEEDIAIVAVTLFHFIWFFWSVDYLILLRGNFIKLVTNAPDRNLTIKPT